MFKFNFYIITIHFLLCFSFIFMAKSVAVKICRYYNEYNVYVHGHGRCVNFEKCPRLFEIIKNPEKTVEEISLLQNITCGFDGDNPKICCPMNELLKESAWNSSNFDKTPITFPESAEEPVLLNPLKIKMHSGKQSSPRPKEVTNSKLLPGLNNSIRSSESVSIEQHNIQSKMSPLYTVKYSVQHPSFKLLPKLAECSIFLGPVRLRNRIIGGLHSCRGSHPWIARIGFRNIETQDSYLEFQCSGTIINNRYILTAAHCTENMDPQFQPVIIRLGEHNDETDPDCGDHLVCSFFQEYKIEKITRHLDYNREDKSNDIGLIRVDRDIQFNIFIRPVCLPYGEEYGIGKSLNNINSQFDNTFGWVAGWGRTKWYKAQGSNILKEAKLPIVPNDICQSSYGVNSKIKVSAKQMCVGGIEGTETCRGDSGSPFTLPIENRKSEGRLARKLFQMGIVSFGRNRCGSGGTPVICTRVSAYTQWILDNIRP